MAGHPLDAYKTVESNTLTGRELEAMVLSKAAMVLQDVRNHWEEADLTVRLDEALRYNQRLWTFFQVELGSTENPLPSEIRQNLLSLSKYIDKRTFEVMASPVREKLDILISINNNIAAGLRGHLGEAAKP